MGKLRLLLLNLLLLPAYGAVGWLGGTVSLPADLALPAIWLPAGFALLILWFGGRQLLPGVLAGTGLTLYLMQAGPGLILAALTGVGVAALLARTMTNLRRVMQGEREARRQAEEALARLRGTQDELIQAEKMASLGRLVAGIAHEVATPVGTALAASTRLVQETRGIQDGLAKATLRREQMQDYIEATALAARILQSNMERAARLIESFKHVAVDRTRQDRRRFDLVGYIEEVLISLRPQTRKTPHKISLTGASRLPVDLYPDAVAQLVTNLLVNAITHAFPGGQAGEIVISLGQDAEGWVELRVSDNGVGIAPDAMPHIFEPFFTTRRTQGGSGLGLYLAYCQVTQRLGGSLTVSPMPTGGALFLARFPSRSPEYQTPPVPAAESAPAPINLAEKRLSA
ncbi:MULTISPECIES: sensor histidine kinase [unclassified Azospirillum]|uniref:sensor histidine kinase n=1 Tax=unclassified Azospirillum TaxID=2630922 RepID=UPI00135A3ECE|nr:MULTISPECIES: HAMP domain-containing sensor histidine kinase [unclassified Azospirillum]